MEMAVEFLNWMSVTSLVESFDETLYLGSQDLFNNVNALYYSRRADGFPEQARLTKWSSSGASSWSYSWSTDTKSAPRFETAQACIMPAGDSSRTNPQHFKGLKCMQTDFGHLGMKPLDISDSVLWCLVEPLSSLDL